MLNISKNQQVEKYVTFQGKVVLVKEWPKVDKVVSQSWGNAGYDRHHIQGEK